MAGSFWRLESSIRAILDTVGLLILLMEMDSSDKFNKGGQVIYLQSSVLFKQMKIVHMFLWLTTMTKFWRQNFTFPGGEFSTLHFTI